MQSFQHCPLCKTQAQQFQFLTDRGQRFAGEKAVLCPTCGLVLLNPRMSDDENISHYTNDVFSKSVRSSDNPDEQALAYRDMRAKRRWQEIRKNLPKTGRCLEIGCSSGNFMKILASEGYDVTGIDPSTGYAQHAKEQGLDVYIGYMPDDLPLSQYDLIFMFHVIEHIPNPLKILKEIRSYLAPGGLLVIEYPDITRAAEHWYFPSTYFQKDHLYDFSERTIRHMLAIAGYEVSNVIYGKGSKLYRKNVTLFTSASDAEQPQQTWDSDAATDLYITLRRKLYLYNFLRPFRPIVQTLRGRFKK